MSDLLYDVVTVEEDIDEPVPASELQELDEEKRILSSVYRHVEDQQAVDQVAGVAVGTLPEGRTLSVSTIESKSPSSPWLALRVQRTPSIPISAVESECSGSASAGHQIRMSAGGGSTEAGDIARADTVSELLNLTPSLDSALQLNMSLQRRFRDKIQKLEIVFKKNLERQAKLKDEITNAKWLREQDQKIDGCAKNSLRISHFCVPYFKNRSGMPAPMNDDAKTKVKTGYIDLYVTRPRTWLTVERETLDEIVRKEWKEQSINLSEMAFRFLERKLRNVDIHDKDAVNTLQKDIKNIRDEIKTLESASLDDILPERGEKRLDWDRIAARAFDGHRTSDECRLQWENLLHPSINTQPFTENEDLIIQQVVMNSRGKIPDWEKMAKDMRSNRTAFQVMQRYVSFIKPTMKPNRWSKRDIDKLLHTVNMLRVGSHIPWAQVHQHFVGFSRAQIQSRWRMIDPELSKGPFTVEEDFILIKGLHMFGLNFDSIAHFMPGRIQTQVKERYKRTILPGLTVRPWTKEEDAIMIKECSVGPRNWRKMIMEVPRFDACQIRCRYHTIQVWQTISGTTMIPPPLFPVTATVNPESIQEIRKAMILESSNLKQLVDESRKGIKLKNVVKELEERRLIIKQRKSGKNMQKMKKVTERRGRMPGISNPHYQRVQDILLTEFFIPHRHYVNFPSLSFDCVKDSLSTISNFLQLKILKRVTENEAMQLSALGLTSLDFNMVEELTLQHLHSGEKPCGNNCPACEPVTPESIPLFPPNKTTIGAFKSLLVHRPKLNEMATKEFFLYRYDRYELMNMNASFKGKRCGRKRSNYTLQQSQASPLKKAGATGSNHLQGAGSISETEASQDESDVGVGGGQSQEDQVPSVSGSKGVSSQTKFHITTVKEKGAKVKRSHPKGKWVPNIDASHGEIKAYSRDKCIKAESVETPNIKLEVQERPVEEVTHSRKLSKEEEEAYEASESLLFQRMLSIFYWPGMMTLSSPPEDLIYQINQKIESGEINKPATSRRKPKMSLRTKDDLEIDEQVEYISYLNEVETQHQERKGNKSKPKINPKEFNVDSIIAEYKRSERSSSEDKVQVDSASGISCQNGEVEGDQANDTSSPKTEVESEDPNHISLKNTKEVDGRRFNSGLASHFRKKNLKSLRRSLIMKTIWDARRNGSYPQRTSNRDSRHYNPRASRTRNSVRKEMLKKPKLPNPWDFPLDGPLKVQPQVPFIPSEEMLNLAFSENSSNEIDSKDDIKTTKIILGASAERETKIAGNKKHGFHKEIETPVKAQNSSDSLLSGMLNVLKSESEVQSKMTVEGKSKAQNTQKRRKKSLNSDAQIVDTVVEVHAAMNDEPKMDVQYKDKPEKSNAFEVVNAPNTSNKDLTSVKSSKIIPTDTAGVEDVTNKEDLVVPQNTLEKVEGPSLKRVFEPSFQNLLEDSVDTERNEGEKCNIPIKIECDEENVLETPVKKPKLYTSQKSYQVSFQSLLDDHTDTHESSQSRGTSPVSVELPVKIKPLVHNPSRSSRSVKNPRKSVGDQTKLAVASSSGESQALERDLASDYQLRLINNDQQLKSKTIVYLQQLPQTVVQPLLCGKSQVQVPEEVGHLEQLPNTTAGVKNKSRKSREAQSQKHLSPSAKQPVLVKSTSAKRKLVSDETKDSTSGDKTKKQNKKKEKTS